MAVHLVREKRERGGKLTLSGADDAQRTFEAYSDDPADTHAIVVAQSHAFGLPELADAHPDEPALVVREIQCRQREGSRLHWLITVVYQSETGQNQQQQNQNPEDEPVKRSWGRERLMLPLAVDLDGLAVITTSGESFDPPVEVRRSLGRLTFVRNELTFDGSAMLAYLDHVNSTTFAGGAPGTVYCDDVAAEERFRRGASYWSVTYVFLHDPRGWQPRPLNQGYYEIRGERKRILDADGEPIAVPVPLDESGVAIPVGDLPGGAFYRVFRGYASANFHDLGLPV